MSGEVKPVDRMGVWTGCEMPGCEVSWNCGIPVHNHPAPVVPDSADPRAFEHTPEASALGAAIEQAVLDSGVGWDEVHPTEVACRLLAAGYRLAVVRPTVTGEAEVAGVLRDVRCIEDEGNQRILREPRMREARLIARAVMERITGRTT